MSLPSSLADSFRITLLNDRVIHFRYWGPPQKTSEIYRLETDLFKLTYQVGKPFSLHSLTFFNKESGQNYLLGLVEEPLPRSGVTLHHLDQEDGQEFYLIISQDVTERAQLLQPLSHPLPLLPWSDYSLSGLKNLQKKLFTILSLGYPLPEINIKPTTAASSFVDYSFLILTTFFPTINFTISKFPLLPKSMKKVASLLQYDQALPVNIGAAVPAFLLNQDTILVTHHYPQGKLVKVILPPGTWYHLDSGQVVTGNQRTPLFLAPCCLNLFSKNQMLIKPDITNYLNHLPLSPMEKEALLLNQPAKSNLAQKIAALQKEVTG